MYTHNKNGGKNLPETAAMIIVTIPLTMPFLPLCFFANS